MKAPNGIAPKDKRHVLHSSEAMDWQTPQFIRDLVECMGPIECDPATTPSNPMRANVIFTGLSPDECGLRNPWPTDGLTFVNPPYGRYLGGPVDPDREVIKKGEVDGIGTGWAARIARHDGECIALLPVRVETDWWGTMLEWADWHLYWSSPYFGRRINFVDPTTGIQSSGSNIASVLFYRGPRQARFLEVFARHGRPSPGPRTMIYGMDAEARAQISKRFPLRHIQAVVLPRMISALYVETDGVYFGIECVDPWDGTESSTGESYDARLYDGPHPVIAHPPCKRWGRYWSGGPSAKVRRKKGDDGGCFASAIEAVRRYGGVLEHPEASHAWVAFGLTKPPKSGGWIDAGDGRGWTCCVEQGHYGHPARKATWLYAVGCDLPEFKWGKAEGKVKLEQGGDTRTKEQARATRAAPGYKARPRMNPKKLASTPVEFRDILLAMARSVSLVRGDMPGR